VSSTLILTSLGQLLRRIHDALDGWTPPLDTAWSQEIPDPHGGPIIAHTDIWPGNVITRDGRVTAIIDWELAAPGRRIWDVVSTAKLCVPFTAPSRRDRAYDGQDVTDRLQDFLDAYQLDDTDRAIFTQVLEERRIATERFVRGRIAHREAHFVEKWDHPAGEELLLAETAWIKTVPADIARSQQTP
jgi:aminoglycoside phosphotransferase (APT) family kinase protein